MIKSSNSSTSFPNATKKSLHFFLKNHFNLNLDDNSFGSLWVSIFILDLNLKPIFGYIRYSRSTLIQVEPRRTAIPTAIDHQGI